MQIISHRGYWKEHVEKNQIHAFKRSFSLGFGTETDVRDLNGKIIISHDMPSSEDDCLTFDDFLKIYTSYDNSLPIAINIKADGLQSELKESLHKYGVFNYRLFDMSLPDLIATKKLRLEFLTRLSDIENEPLLLDDSKGIWLDSFESDWFDENDIKDFLKIGKEVWIVSPELHGREHISVWQMLKKSNLLTDKMIILCTDFPELAKEFFYAED